MAFDLTTIDPSEFIAFRDQWIKESGLESVGADVLFGKAGLSELVEYNDDDLRQFAKEREMDIIETKRLIKAINKLNGIEVQTPRTPRTPRTPMTPSYDIKQEQKQPEQQESNYNKPLSPKTATLEISTSTSSGSSNKKPKTRKKRAKSNAGKDNQDNKKLSTKRDKMKRKRSKSRGKKSPTPSKNRSKSKARSGTRSPSNASDAPMYDPTNKTTTEEVPIISSPRIRDDEIDEEKDMLTQINEAIEKLTMDASSTKTEIRKTFMEFKQKITDREIKLLHDVDTTLDKKRRLLETQLEYVKDNSFGSKELACNPNMSLLIEKPEIMRTLITAGWVQGATSGINISYHII